MSVKQSVVNKSVAIVLEAFTAVERRDMQHLLALYHPEVEFHWTPSLPFGGSSRAGVKDRRGPGWSEVWEPLQPTEAERRMDPRVVAATEKEVVVHWHQRAVSPSGERFDGEVLGLYEVRGGKFARAQMFYFDAIAVERFLAGAEADRAPVGATQQAPMRTRRPQSTRPSARYQRCTADVRERDNCRGPGLAAVRSAVAC